MGVLVQKGLSSLKRPHNIIHWQGQTPDQKELPLKTPVFKHSQEKTHLRFLYIIKTAKISSILAIPTHTLDDSFKSSMSQNPHTHLDSLESQGSWMGLYGFHPGNCLVGKGLEPSASMHEAVPPVCFLSLIQAIERADVGARSFPS